MASRVHARVCLCDLSCLYLSTSAAAAAGASVILLSTVRLACGLFPPLRQQLPDDARRVVYTPHVHSIQCVNLAVYWVALRYRCCCTQRRRHARNKYSAHPCTSAFALARCKRTSARATAKRREQIENGQASVYINQVVMKNVCVHPTAMKESRIYICFHTR